MKKIYYLQKYEVKLGDIVEYNGTKTVVTEELIELIPELFSIEEGSYMDLWAYIPSIKKEPFKLGTQPMYFKSLKGTNQFTTGRVYKQVDSIGYPTTIKLIADDNNEWVVNNWQSVYMNEYSNCFELTTKEEWDKQELLDKAKRDYPAGTMINNKHGMQEVLNDEPFIGKVIVGSIQINTDKFPGGATIYTPENGWCEILPFKFITEDRIPIYGDMETYLVNHNDRSSDICSCHGPWDGDSESKDNKYFYHKENALAYIENLKEKTLRDYEEMLFKSESSIVFSGKGTYYSTYDWIRDNEPKLYYTKILQLIADDLNDGWVADFTNYDDKWCVAIEDIVRYINLQVHGVVYFKEYELAEKARDILGDKVKYLFK